MALAPGTKIVGRFEVLAPIGAGSMGEVYQAHDLKLRRDVALKLLSAALATSEEHLLRFERESRTASALNHPHICTIYDVGQAPEADGRPYLVMELLRGSTLYEAMASGPLQVSTVINLGVQVADALDAAHGAGIIHRDLKPANIFVTSRGDAKLLDFGLAAVIAGAADASSAGMPGGGPLTSLGTAVGTVLYMSPEQALGDPLDPRTDIFSLGLVLYEMLTGRRAFEGRSNTAIVDAILHAAPTGLEAADISAVPKELRRLVARMLEKDREYRPSTAAEVAARLRAVQSGSMAGREYAATSADSSPGSSKVLHIPAKPYTGPQTPAAGHESSGLSRALAPGNIKDVLTVILLLALFAVGAYGTYTWYRGPAAPPAPREPLLLADFSNSTGEAVFDGALKDALEIQLQQSPYVKVLQTSQVRTSLQLMERSPTEPLTAAVARDLCERLGVKAILLGSIAPLSSAYVITLEAQACRTGDTLARDQAQAASKTDVLATVGGAAARIRERLGESIGSIQKFNVPAPNATTSSLEALKAYSMGVETRVKTGEVQSVPMFEHALEIDPNFALASARLAAIYTNLGDLDRAQQYIKRAFARSESLSEPERLLIRSQYHFVVTGRLEEVVATYKLWIGTYPDDWVPHNNLSAAYQRLGQMEDAESEARAAIRLAPDSVVPYQQLTRVLLAMDRLADAKATISDANARDLDSSALRMLSFQLAFLADDADGMQAQVRAASSRVDSYLLLAEAARAALASGDIEASRGLYARAITASRAAPVADVAGTLLAEQALGDALLGDGTRAHNEIQQALSIGNGVDTKWTAALAAAFSGRSPQAVELAAAYQRDQTPSPDVTNALAPMLRAAIDLANNDGRHALTALEGAVPYERYVGPALTYLRGLAYESLRDHQHAIAEFRNAAGHRGSHPTDLLHSLARLALARALTAAANPGEARQAYGDFAKAWHHADPQQPLLVTAQREAAALP